MASPCHSRSAWDSLVPRQELRPRNAGSLAARFGAIAEASLNLSFFLCEVWYGASILCGPGERAESHRSLWSPPSSEQPPMPFSSSTLPGFKAQLQCHLQKAWLGLSVWEPSTHSPLTRSVPRAGWLDLSSWRVRLAGMSQQPPSCTLESWLSMMRWESTDWGGGLASAESGASTARTHQLVYGIHVEVDSSLQVPATCHPGLGPEPGSEAALHPHSLVASSSPRLRQPPPAVPQSCPGSAPVC
jgi:hypothetical protein